MDTVPSLSICWRKTASASWGTVRVPERYALPREGQIVEIRYLYCHPGADGKLIQAKYFGKIRDDVAIGDCSASQLKLKADESDSTES
jgi:bifunctional non-homologous end joining protein LigD